MVSNLLQNSGRENYGGCPAHQVRVITSATATPRVASVLDYWGTVVSRLPSHDPNTRDLRR